MKRLSRRQSMSKTTRTLTQLRRLLLRTIYQQVLGDYTNEIELKKLHAQKFPIYIRQALKVY